MTPHTALLFQTHFFDRGSARLFERLRQQCPPGFECFVLMHVPASTPKPRRLASVPHHFVTTPEIRALDYPRKNSERDWNGQPWQFWNGGHCDLVPLHFYNSYPEFARYWVVEYDVRFTGDWRTFFDAFEASGADFLSTSIRRRRDSPVWVNWDSVQGPMPEDHVERNKIAAFTPLFRASRRAMALMDASYRAGWGGHLEAAWPTILGIHGLVLEDIGGDGEFVRPGNRDRFYTSAKPTAMCGWLAPGTVTARPVLHRPGSTPNRLYHPVKPFKLWPEAKLALREARIWQGARRRQLAAWLRSAGRTVRG